MNNKEIHGMDETVWIDEEEHLKIPCNRIRLGKDVENISRRGMKRITTNAYKRTQKAKEWLNRNRLRFSQSVDTDIQLIEEIKYFPTTGNIGVSSWFHAGTDIIVPKFDFKDEAYIKAKIEREENSRKYLKIRT